MKEEVSKMYFGDKCLHCSDGKPNYCEECYQELVSENAKLQREVKLMASKISELTIGSEVINKQFEKEYCSFINTDEECCMNNGSCADCIKEYFDNKIGLISKISVTTCTSDEWDYCRVEKMRLCRLSLLS